MAPSRILMIVQLAALFYGVAAQDFANNTDIQLFQEYLQINTTTGAGDWASAVEFWTRLAGELDAPISVNEYESGYPVVVITFEGNDPSLKGIMLNSHMDVVPANEDGWTYPPFSAYLDEDGDIWARGSQDMKSVGMQYYMAIRNLKANNVTLLRNIYMTLMPDEETGGRYGMIKFLESDNFTTLNVGFGMDEGTSYPISQYPLFYQDKAIWQFTITCVGEAGHGSVMIETNLTATGECRRVIDTFLDFREEQYLISKTASLFNAGVYTSVNLNILSGGTAANVVPETVSLTFDVRLDISLNHTEFAAQIEEWCADAGTNVTVNYILQEAQTPATVHNSSNPYYVALEDAAETLGITLVPVIPPGATDSRHVRGYDIPAFGFSPMANTTLLLHSVNERLNAATFLRGIEIYEEFLTNLANISTEDTGEAESSCKK